MSRKAIRCLASPIFAKGIFVLKPGRDYTIGRDQTSDISLPSQSVSRRHATLTCLDDGHLLYDLRSRNGTEVNDRPISAEGARLTHQDRITIGPFDLVYNQVQTDLGSFLAEVQAGGLDGETRLDVSKKKGETSELLSGRLDEMALVETCQLLAHAQRDGLLRIRSSEQSGQILIFGGNIVHVTGARGEPRKKARALLGLQEGEYTFTADIPEMYERHLGKPPIPLLPMIMEICREWDEAGREVG